MARPRSTMKNRLRCIRSRKRGRETKPESPRGQICMATYRQPRDMAMSPVGMMQSVTGSDRPLIVTRQLEISPYSVHRPGRDHRHRSFLGHRTGLCPGGTLVAAAGLHLYRRCHFCHGTSFGGLRLHDHADDDADSHGGRCNLWEKWRPGYRCPAQSRNSALATSTEPWASRWDGT